MAIHLPSPPIVYQGQSWLCWAAAIESWAMAVYKERVPQNVLLNQMKTAGMTDKRGGVDPLALPWITNTFNMNCHPPLAKAWKQMLSTVQLTEALLKPFMANGPIVLITAVGQSIGHCYVIYGADGNTVFYMDPSIKGKYQVGKNTSLGSHCVVLYAGNSRKRSNWSMLLQPSII